jgi:mRNA-degrading endonuclease RelE of RelBE toxin-antitoxin system
MIFVCLCHPTEACSSYHASLPFSSFVPSPAALLSTDKQLIIYLIILLFTYKKSRRTVEDKMIVFWSRRAKRQLTTIDSRYRQRIADKLRAMDDKNAPAADIKKLSMPEGHYRLRVGDYRIIFTLDGDTCESCYVVAIKRRTSTTYLHEEATPYGSAIN